MVRRLGGERARRSRPWLAAGLSCVAVIATALVAVGCDAGGRPTNAVGGGLATPGGTSPAGSPGLAPAPPTPAPVTPAPYGLGTFPAFPPGPLSTSTAASLQAVIDDAVARGTFAGITASVIVADCGSWTGATGSGDGVPLTPESRRPTHSSAKTIVAAEILRLADEGRLALDGPAATYLPAELAFVDTNGATIRQVLGMRSGIPDLNEADGYYPAEQASTVADVFRMLPSAGVPAGTELNYASTNYVLLGAIVEHLTDRPLAEALRAGVLDRPGLEGIVYTVDDALAGDGWGVEATASSLARWAYELYGGHVVSEESLRAMVAFDGDWYGLGTFDYSANFGGLAAGHDGESSVTTCCSVIRVVAVTAEGIAISVQADTGSSTTDRDYWRALGVLTTAIRNAARV